MALNEQQVLFQYGLGTAAGAKNAGAITFDSVNKAIYVGDGTDANLVTSAIKDASFDKNTLTISFVDAERPAIALDFSDVASTENVMAVFKQLNTAIAANTTAIGEEADARELADASIRKDFTDADTALSNRIAALEEGEESVGAQIAEAIGALNSSKEAEDASKFVKVKVDIVNGKLSDNGVVVTTTNIASAEALAEVKETADAAAVKTATDASLALKADASVVYTKTEIDTNFALKTDVSTAEQNAKDYADGLAVNYDASGAAAGALTDAKAYADDLDTSMNTRVEAIEGKVDGWDAATVAINNFLTGTGTAEVVDTLKDIQDWMKGDGVDATELTKAIADEAKLRADADTSIRNDFVAADTALDASLKTYVDGRFTNEVTNKFDASGAAAGALAEAKSYVDGKVDGKFDAAGSAAQALTDAKAYTDGKVDGKFDAAGSASAAEAAAKSYADAITVNGQTQDSQKITIKGANILVGGTGNHETANVAAAIEDLYTKVGDAAEAGVQSLAINDESSAYAEVNASTGAVTLTIKKVAIADATAENTGVADALDVKNSIDTAKAAAVSTVVGTAADASSADTVYGAKAYAKAFTEAALKWTVLE